MSCHVCHGSDFNEATQMSLHLSLSAVSTIRTLDTAGPPNISIVESDLADN